MKAYEVTINRRRCPRLAALIAVPLAGGHVGAPAQRERGKPFDKSITTVAGELSIKETEEVCAYEIRLAGKLLLKTDCQDEKFTEEPDLNP